MSASLIAALIWGAVTSMSVTNEVLDVLDVLVLLVETEVVGPPLIHWPTTPFKLATVPLTGATSVAAWRLYWASWSAAVAFATCAFDALMSDCSGGASVCAAVACCVCSAAWFCATVFWADC